MNRTLTPVPSLFDGDNASSAARASVIASLETVRQAQEDAAYAEEAGRAKFRADAFARFARATSWEAELKILAEAARFDRAHPSEPSLYDELHGMTLGLAA